MTVAELTPELLRKALDRFLCRRCGRCCEGPGGLVFLTEEDAEGIARALDMDLYAFTQACTRLAPNRRGLVLLDRADGACIFLTEQRTCRVQAAKPRQCRDFPQQWRNPGFERHCAGMRAALESLSERQDADRPAVAAARNLPDA